MPRFTDIAVVIPVGPGERAWEPLLPQLAPLGECVLSCVSGEVAVLALPWRVVDGPGGRAAQLNAGARATTRPWLWFLHADSRLAPETLPAVARAEIADAIGYCDLAFYDGPRRLRLNAFLGNLRSRLFGLPFGDQGLLMSRALYERLGGFDETLATAEDHALIWAARRFAVRVERLGAPLLTSGRRYRDEGWTRVTLRHLANTVLQVRRFA